MLKPLLFGVSVAVVAIACWSLPPRYVPSQEAAFVVPNDSEKMWCFVPPAIAPEFTSAIVRTKQEDGTEPQPAYLCATFMAFIVLYAAADPSRFSAQLQLAVERAPIAAMVCLPMGAFWYWWNRSDQR